MYDVCVIGAGVNGSSAAYNLSKRDNVKVLLLEQFPVPHTRGSSHGQTRVIRCMYYDEVYSIMSRDSFPLWRELEKETGDELMIQNGYLEVFEQTKTDRTNYARCRKVLDAVGAQYEILNGVDVNARFPPFNFPSTCTGIYEPAGGTLLASKCVNSFQKAFVKNGGTFKDNSPVTRIVPGDVISVITPNGKYRTKSLIITAGPFTTTLTSQLGLNLPIQPMRVYPCYWKINGEQGDVRHNFPTWKAMLNVYGLAAHEYPGMMKICEHSGDNIDPNVPNTSPQYSIVQEFLKLYMKDVDLEPSVVESCFYTTTPDNFFIIDVHPCYNNIVIGAGFCGTGFKMSPVSGAILADLALKVEPTYELSYFKLGRFDNVVETKSQL